jgi:hypothetical protein
MATFSLCELSRWRFILHRRRSWPLGNAGSRRKINQLTFVRCGVNVRCVLIRVPTISTDQQVNRLGHTRADGTNFRTERTMSRLYAFARYGYVPFMLIGLNGLALHLVSSGLRLAPTRCLDRCSANSMSEMVQSLRSGDVGGWAAPPQTADIRMRRSNSVAIGGKADLSRATLMWRE